MTAIVDMIGMKYGKLVVLRRLPNFPSRGRRWLCRCDCGVEIGVGGQCLRRGHTTSCGCARDELARERATIHGKSGTREYAIWCGMIGRCTNRNRKQFNNYGGRGIMVCERWASFENFLADMGECPPGLTIERKNNDGNYDPDNCIWADELKQANNKRRTRRVTYRGRWMSLSDAVRAAGSIIHREAAAVRIKTGWSVERAVETPRLFVSHNSKSTEAKSAARRQ